MFSDDAQTSEIFDEKIVAAKLIVQAVHAADHG